MNKARFLSILGNLNRVSHVDTSALRTFSEEYPSAALVQMIYLKALQQENSFLYQKQLKRTALIVPDRKLLYAFLNPDESQEKTAIADREVDVSPPSGPPKSVVGTELTNEKHAAPTVEPAGMDVPRDSDSSESKQSPTISHESESEEAASIEVASHQELDEPVGTKGSESSSKHPPEKGEANSDEKNKDQTEEPPKATISATRITQSGKVEIDLDRLPPRAREVIERSMALRAKLNKGKTDQIEKAIQQPDQPAQPNEPDFHQVPNDSGEQVSQDIDKSLEGKNLSEDVISEKEVGHIDDKGHSNEAVEEVSGFNSESDIEAHSEQVGLDVQPEETNAGAEVPTGVEGFPFLVFSASEIEEVKFKSEPEPPQIFFEPAEAPTQEVPDSQSEDLEMAAPHTFFEWLQIAETGILPYEKAESSQSPEDKMKLIDAFLEKVPAIKPVKGAVISKPNLVIQQQPQAMETLMTETLAGVYVSQKHYDEAIRAYEILRLKYPEKSSYFADLISKVKKLKNSSQ